MVAARRRNAAAVIVTALVVTVALFVALAVTQPPTSAETTAVLTVFTGTAEIQKSHTATFTRAESGDQLSGGDAIRTGAETKAAITYPSGTVARLDSNTRLTISQFGRSTGGGWNMEVFQAVGKSWSRMSHLAGGSSYIVNAPNSVAAEVRGTEFEVIVETHGGSTVVRLDVFAGVVAATANRGSETVSSGQSTSTSYGLPPTWPGAISAADRQDSFTVFNETADASYGKPVSVNTNRFVTAETTGVMAGPTGDGSTDLQFTLGWPGSRFELTVFDPAGTVYARVSSAVSPVTIVVADAQTGVWRYEVTDIESMPGEVWWVIVSQIPDAPTKSQAGGSSSTPPGAPAPPAGAPHSKPSQAAGQQPPSSSALSPVTPVVAAAGPILAPITPVVAAVTTVLAPVTDPVVAAVAPLVAPLTPVVAVVTPILAPVTSPVVAAVSPLLAPVAPVVAAVSPLLAAVPSLAPPPPSPPPVTAAQPTPQPASLPPAPTPAPAGPLNGLLDVVASSPKLLG